MIKYMIVLLSLVVSSLAYGEVMEVMGWADTTINGASVQQHIPLVQSQKGDSDLRVSFLVTDNGGSTDVSPRARLFLSTFNESEMRGASSLHPISQINNVVSYRRVKAGVYEAVVRMYDFDAECGNDFEAKVKLTIDARQLTVDVRSFKDVEEFDSKTFQTPITVEKTCL